MQFLRISIAVFAIAVVFAQTPKPGKKQIREVRATGCVRIAPNGCVLLKTLDGNTTYTFRLSPKPQDGTVITIEGTAHDGPSQCKQGLAIDVTDWDPTGDSCVE